MDLNWITDMFLDVSPISVAIALLVVLATIAYFVLSSRGLPPGPIGVPVLGYWPFLATDATHVQMDGLKTKYGDVFSFTCSGTLYVHLGTAKAIREAHIAKADCFGSRITQFCLFKHAFEDSIGFANGEPWKVLRKFFTATLKERGAIAIKNGMSSLYESIDATIQQLRTDGAEGQDIVQLLSDKCNDILRQMLFSDSGVTADQVREITDHYGELTRGITAANMLLTGNVAKVLFPFLRSTRTSLRHLDPMEKAIYKIIEDHKSSYNEDNIRDIVDDYIKERDLRRSKGDPTAQYFTDKALMASLLQFIGDGVLGVALFIAFFLKNLLLYPEEQEKIYKEIVEVAGTDRELTIEDKSRLTYTNAFVLEVLRTTEFFPLFPSQQCTKETTLGGFRIPVGAVTLINSYSAQNDPEVYQDPEKFNPERYISKDGAKRAELPVTFGIGKRSCLGEGFTMAQVFLFLTSIVKNFELKLKNPNETTHMDLFTGKLEITAKPRS